MINKSPEAFYKSKKMFDSDCKIEPVVVTKLAGQKEEKIDPLKISAPITFDADFSTGKFIIVDGLKNEGIVNFLKEVLVELLKESKNV